MKSEISVLDEVAAGERINQKSNQQALRSVFLSYF
jgi:hypothetical protein